MSAHLVLFDDSRARAWRPFTLTRPAGELIYGGLTLRARAEQVFGLSCVGHRTDPALAGFAEPDTPPVLEQTPEGDVVYLSARAVPGWGARIDTGTPGLLTIDRTPCGLIVPAGHPHPDPAFFEDPAAAAPDLPPVDLPGRWLGPVWDLISGTPEQTARDITALFENAQPAEIPAHAWVLGEHPVYAGSGVRIEPGAILDTRDGPIYLAADVVVKPFTTLVGPSWVGVGSTLLGGPFHMIVTGPVCKVHGEVEETVVLGYSNKAHDGFLGHAYLGRWVNLGALTTNSDLKNNYGTIRIWTPDGDVDTGLMKVGCLLGDHVKTAIGTMLNTGTVIGAGSNIFGGMPPKYVPPFTWGGAGGMSDYAADKFVEVARVVSERRKLELAEGQERMLRRAWERTRGEREAARQA